MISDLKRLTAAGHRRTKQLLLDGEEWVGTQGSYIGILEYYVALMAQDDQDTFEQLLEELKHVPTDDDE